MACPTRCNLSYVVRRTSYVLLPIVFSFLSANASQDPAAKVWEMPGIEWGKPRIMVIQNLERLDPPKISPKHKWMFEWICSGLGKASASDTQYQLRVRVFAQQKKEENDPGPMVARMAMRLWDYNLNRFNLQHKDIYDQGRVHFYLCFGGNPGAEQLFDEDEEQGNAKRVNTIYLYQIQNLKDPVELAREVAHEYGHATLPAVGGFKDPEDWGNGYLGEKLYLRFLRDMFLAKKITKDDVMGATLGQLDAFVKREVDPLAAKVGLNGPDIIYNVNGSGLPAMNAYLGLALYSSDILPTKVFARSLVLTGSTKASDYPNAVVAAAAEVETYVIDPPEYLKGKDFWIPLGKGKLNGITPIRRSGDWALIRPLNGIVRVTNTTR